ncbi:hypothetical protein CWRG_02233 [Chthonomonas calidirosea]|uniref:Uncharacterized protein n=1 Tax=Chthonomonas calidirosea (strain DSM 23976 / ICMP 18418 / T49) TaxID=1303518 RepID=S0EW35_CHTCT|nr:archaellin/type IV pilin N-terminal domain-containing protein [Chthonomonas calidirosea]CCW35653.1 hypothetical protein CCALI_01841 [Chthonomonas calidirosea T49]CEK18628.1 hypothetical protein CWRG_02233 [Chthonomonas calidirosea]CEK19630.1 hypothetical protein CTKA_02253 [Chthonomonas calidirosea]
MKKQLSPLVAVVLIVLAVLIAAGALFYFLRTPSGPDNSYMAREHLPPRRPPIAGGGGR